MYLLIPRIEGLAVYQVNNIQVLIFQGSPNNGNDKGVYGLVRVLKDVKLGSLYNRNIFKDMGTGAGSSVIFIIL